MGLAKAFYWCGSVAGWVGIVFYGYGYYAGVGVAVKAKQVGGVVACAVWYCTCYVVAVGFYAECAGIKALCYYGYAVVAVGIAGAALYFCH